MAVTLAFLSLGSMGAFGQPNNFDFHKLIFKGLGYKTTNAKVTEAFGPGKRIDTNYDCGFFTNDQPGGPYYQLQYAGFSFIGSDAGDFFLERIDFDPNGAMQIRYADKVLDGRTTKEEFIAMFGERVREPLEDPKRNAALLLAKGSDDGATFTFKNNRLVRFEYWTPC